MCSVHGYYIFKSAHKQYIFSPQYPVDIENITST